MEELNRFDQLLREKTNQLEEANRRYVEAERSLISKHEIDSR